MTNQLYLHYITIQTRTTVRFVNLIHCIILHIAGSLPSFSIAKSDSGNCDRCYRSVSVRQSHSCTLLKLLDDMRCHLGRDTDDVVPSNIVLDRSSGRPQEMEILGRNPQSKFALQIAVKPSNGCYKQLIGIGTQYRHIKRYHCRPHTTFPSPQITRSQRCRLVPKD